MEKKIGKSINFIVMSCVLVMLIILTAISCGSEIMILKSLAFWGWVVFMLLHSSSKCWVNKIRVADDERQLKWLVVITAVILSILCVIPMSYIPCFNGEVPDHRNQYELMAESLVHGHLYIDHEVDPKLLEMKNPYDPELRDEVGAIYHWDHAFYNGHYYMYFGIVPVLLIFFPYRILTGSALTTYHATQLFTVLFILGMFRLTYGLASRKNKNMTLGCYLFCVSALCIVSINNIIEAPALYNTAVSSGICFSIWSIYYYIKAFGFFTSDSIDSKCLPVAAFFGALVFGCRPNMGLMNIIIFPVLIWICHCYKNESGKIVKKILCVIVPYLIVGSLLMLYNYVRFDSVFEFGQSYQLTIADQHQYMEFSKLFSVSQIVDCFITIFIGYFGTQTFFPYITYNGILLCYPILWLFVPLIILSRKERRVSEMKAYKFAFTLFLSVLLIILSTVIMSPIPLLERYKGDEYFLICIILFMMLLMHNKSSGKLTGMVIVLSTFTFIVSFLLYFAGESYIQFYFPEKIEYFSRIFWPF